MTKKAHPQAKKPRGVSARRVARPRLERDAPKRAWSGLFGRETRASSDEPAPIRDGSGFMPNAVSETVELGYRVIEDYLREGQQAAKAFGVAGWRRAPGTDDDELQRMAQRVVQYGTDFAGMWMDLAARVAQSSQMWPPYSTTDRGPGQSDGSPRSPPESSGAQASTTIVGSSGVRVTVSIASRRRTTAAVELRAGPCEGLVVQELRCSAGGRAMIRNVEISQSPEDEAVHIAIRIPEKLQPGVYNGLILEADSSLPRGTLSVRVEASYA
jgi:hypothetical protein